MKKRLIALCIPALLATTARRRKTLVFCSEGSPENFYPGINTTGTSFDGSDEIYNKIVAFERGGTKVVPALAETWEISPDGLIYTFKLRNVKWHNTGASSRPVISMPTTCCSCSSGSGRTITPISR